MIPPSVPAYLSHATIGAVLVASIMAPGSVRPRAAPSAAPASHASMAVAPVCAPTPQDAWTLAQQAVAAGDAGLVTERLSLDFRARNALEMAIAALPIGMWLLFSASDRATGVQHYLFIDQQTHDMRLGWYTDEYVRTPDGWRIRSRSSTFLRRHGGYDAGIPHDPLGDA